MKLIKQLAFYAFRLLAALLMCTGVMGGFALMEKTVHMLITLGCVMMLVTIAIPFFTECKKQHQFVWKGQVVFELLLLCLLWVNAIW